MKCVSYAIQVSCDGFVVTEQLSADIQGGDIIFHSFAVLPKATDKVPLAKEPVPAATVETYTINRGPKGAEASFIGRSDAGERVVGNADLSEPATAEAFESGEPFGKRLTLTQDERGRTLGRLAT